ncbi:hypothetical protein [Pseudarthrobacter sp. NIBRBAC000502770]|uniref:hypothetical protein n=1 Tax=Pseudarthrobacter sp. NIBRBAC000502770 TaxID=2590785 RepID=UPI00114030C8|nr:hypothetical protein [Pseudarthrobacter sp. NIBRBAC000502770]QDG89090.1 hypothetical protein NIBR502770_11830 [Pseudarthrobacter sp. NIBRBAC000502770]
MSIQIRAIPSDNLVALAPQLNGLYIQTGSVDHNGRLVTGHFQEARLMEDGQRIAIKLTRYMNGKHVLDSVVVPAGNDPLGNPWRTAIHMPSDSALLAQLDTSASTSVAA